MFDAYIYTGLNLAGIPAAKVLQKQRYDAFQHKCGPTAWHRPKNAFEYALHGMWRYLRTAKTVLITGPDPWLAAMELQSLDIQAQLYASGNLTAQASNSPNRAVQARLNAPGGLGGPRRITDHEIAFRYSDRQNALLAYAKAISPHVRMEAVLDLISIIKEPRWFATVSDTYGLNALLAYMGLAGYTANTSESTSPERLFAGLTVTDLLSERYRVDRRKAAIACIGFDEIVADICTPSVDLSQNPCLLKSVAFQALQVHGEQFAELEVAKLFVTLLVHGWFAVSMLPERPTRYNEFVDTNCLAGIVTAPLRDAFFNKVKTITECSQF
jgi:hypothetical protein